MPSVQRRSDSSVKDRCLADDLDTTTQHLMGLDHAELTCPNSGRTSSLIDADVLHDITAQAIPHQPRREALLRIRVRPGNPREPS